MRARRHVVLASVALVALAACQLIVGVDDEAGVPRPVTTEAGSVDAGPVDPCRKHVPPPRSEVPAPDDKLDLVFAVRQFVAQPSQGTLGYDLDGRCTGIDGSTTADPPCVGPSPSRDADGGVDNGIAKVLETFKVFSNTDDPVGQAATNNIAGGVFTNLIGVFGYNGQKNDPSVQVQVVVSVGLRSVGCDGGTTDGGGERLKPQWDGCDTWNHTPDAIKDGANPVWLQVREGYVADDTLVVQIPESKIGIFIGEFAVYDGAMTARIERDANGRVIGLRNGVFAGRASASDMLRVVQFLNFNRTVVCEDPIAFQAIKDALCKGRDIPIHREDDGKGQRCDGVSVAFGFEADPARVGIAEPVPDASCPVRDTSCPP